ncbi:Glycosyltransferase, catalytic subunit of cellulose synthase and poly-beta-1,6-N-acetylglucosamine synthase [Catalinimonas alkaloidigena]|uniref:Glycosyltransferase, catalytic subunit of cellulose synthase and poly-beta-1,6-N-acetylglucosamine synthase n=1 Tax=Catalinimonas alkaloidigena TaxID=1075417 RepID=A0A1G9H390_9BACT|nr:glycosyltransferase [Catalinimonas alkaloidigena]SDL07418.1 Glycosyltransferase, catalytic subunit of cellulose synthase and poly-beta-1,6-N-acetylglucosamine synthase [Catalinimonas alkaloidigena]
MIVLNVALAVLTALIFFFLVFHFASGMLSLLAKDNQVVPDEAGPYQNFACVITAYRDADVAGPLVAALLQQHYPHYRIYLVADGCDAKAFRYNDPSLTVLFPEVPLNAKSRSIAYALEHFTEAHDAVVVFDPDNLVRPDYLRCLNGYFQAGYRAVQGMRTAKNLNTAIACLDSLGEFYYNFVVRLVPFRLGSSSTIAGSGMAVATPLYQAHLASEPIRSGKVVAAEDKILHGQLVAQGVRIAFAPEAVVYDEKVDTKEAIQRQRTRWLNGFFKSIPASLALVGRGLRRLNFNQLYFGVMTVYPPLSVLLLATFALIGLNLFLFPGYSLLLAGGLVLFALNFLFVLKRQQVPRMVWRALADIPFFLVSQIKSLLGMKKANRDFLVTRSVHHLSLEEVMHPNSSPSKKMHNGVASRA